MDKFYVVSRRYTHWTLESISKQYAFAYFRPSSRRPQSYLVSHSDIISPTGESKESMALMLMDDGTVGKATPEIQIVFDPHALDVIKFEKLRAQMETNRNGVKNLVAIDNSMLRVKRFRDLDDCPATKKQRLADAVPVDSYFECSQVVYPQ